MRMVRSVVIVWVAGALIVGAGLAVGGCGPARTGRGLEPERVPTIAPVPGEEVTPVSGLREAPDGTVSAVGVLEYVDLEGGFWAITEGDEHSPRIIAVIANGAELKPRLRALRGASVRITGRRFEGVSIRMAGPEVEVALIEPAPAPPGKPR